MGEEFSYSNTSQFMNCESPTITRVSDGSYGRGGRVGIAVEYTLITFM